VITIPETGEAVIVDCIDADAVLRYLSDQSIKHVRGLIITHLHQDHFKDANVFLKMCASVLNTPCETVLFNWPLSRSSRALDRYLSDPDGHSEMSEIAKINRLNRRTAYENLKAFAAEHEDEDLCKPLLRGDHHPIFDGAFCEVIELLQPSHGLMGSLLEYGLNNTSGILRIQGTGTSALLTGDIEPTGWRQLITKTDPAADVLKFPHHGAWSESDVSAILDTVKPSVVVISVGTDANKKYKHPNTHVLQAIKHRNIHMLCTEATDQCEANVRNQQQSLHHYHEIAARAKSYLPLLSPRGCPCAGTVIIELGDSVRILQPDMRLHHDLIEGHLRTAQCGIGYTNDTQPLEAASRVSETTET